MYNFNLLGNAMSFNSKMIKHIQSNNPLRVKDYICAAFDTFNPSYDPSDHPCWDTISQGVKYLKSLGWKVFPAKDIRGNIQIFLKAPTGEYYHSHYNYR